MELRRYVDADAVAVVALFTASVHGLAGAHYDAAQRRAWAPVDADIDDWRRRLAAQHVLLAVDGDALAGFIGYEDDGHIDLLYTAPSHARHGVATRLLAAAEHALIAGRAVRLKTEASAVARPFFERHGFAVMAPEDVSRDGVILRRYVMRKPVHRAL
ncbi:GNAT family N-acetyltransferase [Solimonas marina]|uniref:GNAT family N-acetyltransferase n=1 Tax=Solimonas marina TaxID=2714601 RepID=A0A969WDH4_9GAMM|nr:GNAT family N-acetyltransferase [Solimonas marina]NKF24070.1 GNAT family N-acetyltransferase [Solimonas marina]